MSIRALGLLPGLLLFAGCTTAGTDAPDSEGCDAPQTYWQDADGDGHGLAAGATATACSLPDGYAEVEDDCDDEVATTFPGAAELCNQVDDDCDGAVDDDAPGTESGWLDDDGDGHGDDRSPITQCDGSVRIAAAAGDCDDAVATVHPGAEERCDGVDQDCDGVEDDLDAVDTRAWYPDHDGDGYGADAAPELACEGRPGTVEAAGDCNDDDEAVNPDQAEVCHDGIDQDCLPGGEGCERRGSWSPDSAEGVDRTLGGDEGAGIGEVFAAGDLNGDGAAELALGSNVGTYGAAWLLRGPLATDVSMDDAVLHVQGDDTDPNFGAAVAVLTDRDGDGLGHFAVADVQGGGSDQPGAVYLYATSGDLAVDDADVRLRGVDPYGLFGTWVGDVGDIDGDGAIDVAVGAPEATERGTGALYVWSGVPTGDGTAASATSTLVCTEGGLGWSAAGGLDWNGDGVGDLVVGAPELAPGGAAYVMAGPLAAGETFVDDGSALATLNGSTSELWAGWDLAAVGDQNGDGLDDLAVAGPFANGGEVKVFAGGVAGDVPWTDHIGTFGTSAADDLFGYGIAAGDADGDGWLDLAISAPGASAYGTVGLFYGPLERGGTLASADARWVGEEAAWLDPGVAFADTDGDGLDDLLLGGHNNGGGAGAVFVVLGMGE